ncbi:Bax inhibitor-1/YccA family protein [Phycicoccus duodecadis]|uniref:Putative YccA/Bax inhibitor family protein n=1 Tax=Phycicoccus duodecadis TaxID=173053 RepID=A0A2N3YKQ2_9MICO|nr:Bax inhibitor-1/YccA family protein [Phycicoccus duodecadis]PKW27443.1 putative YccA/Bax inhibitor family protein [Phycicoccus duodecadis]
MASSNPAFNRIEQDARNGYAGFRGGSAPTSGPGEQLSAQQLQDMYSAPSPVRNAGDRAVTMDDVIMKTLALFAIVLVTGGIGWGLAASNPGIGFALWAGGGILMLVLGLVIAFKKTLSVPLIVLYAAVEGVFVGAISQFYALRFDGPGVDTVSFQGIVPQAVLATVATFAGMLIAYKTGLIKVTARFRKIMTMALIGYAIFAVVNFVFAIVTNTAFGIGGSTALGVGISLFAVGLAAFTLALDFDAIDRAIATGAPQKYSWLLAHGLVVTLVWLYLEFLRLLGRLRS